MSVEILQSLATVAKHYQTGTTKVVKTNMFYYMHSQGFFSRKCSLEEGIAFVGRENVKNIQLAA